VWGISGTDLQREWHKTGLRYSDLEHALRHLLQAGIIGVRESTSGRRIYLASGREQFAPPKAAALERLFDRLRLLRLRLRSRTTTPSTSLRRRRNSDRG
jgi:hypothetical protein